MKEKDETKTCPLCGTILPYERWLEVVGVYEEQQKHRKQLEVELSETKKKGLELKEEYRKVRQKEKELKAQYILRMKEERKKIREISANLKLKERTLRSSFEQKLKLNQEKLREKSKQERMNAVKRLEEKFQQQQEKLRRRMEKQKQAELKHIHREGIRAGIEKQKGRIEKVSLMADKYRKDRDEKMERVRQLEDMIKKGTTPQIEGLDFERELAGQLKSRFQGDDIRPTGREGDVIQIVQVEDKTVGKIIYECKKTQDFQNKYIEQIRRDKARAVADYGVIVTWASKEKRQGFWVEGDIIVVHPYGVLDIANILREALVQMYTLKLSKAEFETKGKAMLEFMQSEEFRARIQESIVKSKEAYEVLKKEVKTHMNTWKKRFKIYESIHKNTNLIQNIVRHVLLHGKIPEKLPPESELPALPMPGQEYDKLSKKDIKKGQGVLSRFQ